MSKNSPFPASTCTRSSFFHLPGRRQSKSQKELQASANDQTGEAKDIAIPANFEKNNVVGNERPAGSSHRSLFHFLNLRSTSNWQRSSTEQKESVDPTPEKMPPDPDEREGNQVAVLDESPGGTAGRSFFRFPVLRPSNHSVEEADSKNDPDATPEPAPDCKSSVSTNDSRFDAEKSCNRRFFRFPSRRPREKSSSKGEGASEPSADDGESGISTPSSEKQIVVREAPLEGPCSNPDFSDSKSSLALSTGTNGTASPKKTRRLRPRRFIRRVTNTVGTFATQMEDLFFPGAPISAHRVCVNNGVLLINCQTEEEHEKVIKEVLNQVKEYEGEEGLTLAGFGFRIVYCDVHQKMHREPSEDCASTGKDISPSDDRGTPPLKTEPTEVAPINEFCVEEKISPADPVFRGPASSSASDQTQVCGEHGGPPCSKCTTRLFHLESNTLITEENRRRFIADGDHYDEIARLCQDVAHSMMIRDGELEWETICDDESYAEPIRALIHRDHHVSTGADLEGNDAEPKPTLLIVTGKGKVRAGIFSRQHLMVSGVEPSTALPTVREALQRNMNIVILDPNARGDREGMITFEKSLGELFRHWEDHEATVGSESKHEHELYVLAHSASGAQLVRYLQDKEQCYLPRIRAIAFTDSTHNIQWTRNNANLTNLLESSACVYVRSSNIMRDSNWEEHRAGDTVQTDLFWNRRFGRIRTLWAGTTEHSLANWAAHAHIWEHFDRHLHTGTYFANFCKNVSRHLRQVNEDELESLNSVFTTSHHRIEIDEDTGNSNDAKKPLASSSKVQDDTKPVAASDGLLNKALKQECGEKMKNSSDSPSRTSKGQGVPVGVITV